MLSVEHGRLVISLPRNLRPLTVVRHTVALMIGVSWFSLCAWVLIVGFRSHQQQQPIYRQESTGAAEQHATASSARPEQDSPRRDTGTGLSDSPDWPNIFIAAFTFGLLLVTGLQYVTLTDTLATNRAVERAYVTLCHRPNGLHPSPILGAPNRHAAHMEIANNGATPATVVGGYLAVAHDLPNQGFNSMGWSTALLPGGFLVRKKSYAIWFYWHATPQELQQLAAGQLWLVGYVVYIDAFNARRRAGYARHVDPRVTGGNNLTWDYASAPYNYDIEIDEAGNPKK